MGGHGITNVGTVSARAVAADPWKINLTGQAFVFEGDSITQGANGADYPASHYASAMSFFSGHGTVYNDAVGGSQTPSGSNGGNNITDRYVANVKPHRPAANGGDGGPRSFLFLMIGTNDIANHCTASQLIGDIMGYVATAQADGFTVVLSTITPRADIWNYSAEESYRNTVNTAIRNGTIPASLVIDNAAMLPNFNDMTVYNTDRIHPTTQGQQLLARYLNNVMTANGAIVPSQGGFCEGPLTVSGNLAVNGNLLGTLTLGSGASIAFGTNDFGGANWGVTGANGGFSCSGGRVTFDTYGNFNTSGSIGIGGQINANGDVVIAGSIRAHLTTPSSSSATGTAGQIAWDGNYVYVCTATNTWKRAALSSW